MIRMRELLADVAIRAARYLEELQERRVSPSTKAICDLAGFLEPLPAGSTEADDVIRMLDELGSPATMGIAGPAALNRYGVTAQEIEELVRNADSHLAGLWGPNDDKIVRDVANAWRCLASYGVEASAIRRLLVRKSRDLWKDLPKVR